MQSEPGARATSQDDPPSAPGHPWFVYVVIVAAGGTVAWLRRAHQTTDNGLQNFFTLAVLVITGTVVVLWFVFFSRYSSRARHRGGLIILVALIGFITVFRFDEYNGALVPTRLSFRWAGASVHALPAVRHTGPLDLRPTPADYPGFLGVHRDGRVAGVHIDPDWSVRPPQVLWRQPIGEGWSGFAVVNGVAVTLEQRGAEEAITAYDVATGELRWAFGYGTRFDHALGGPGPRCTPSISEGRVYALGSRGEWMCLDGTAGTLLWSHDLLDDYGISAAHEASTILYGRSNSPLLVDDMAIIPVGGAGRTMANVVAYDQVLGTVVWSGAPRQISFSSPACAELAGRRQVLIVNEASLSGHDVATGRLLWEHPWPGVTSRNANVSQAVPVPPNRVFVSKGYGLGAALLELLPDEGGTLRVEELWSDTSVLRTKFTNVVIKDDHVYGLSDGILECVQLNTGERVWKRGRYGHGQVLLVGEHLLVLSEDGEVILIEASPGPPQTSDHELARIQAIAGLTWNNPACYHDILLVRNGREASAIRLPLIE